MSFHQSKTSSADSLLLRISGSLRAKSFAIFFYRSYWGDKGFVLKCEELIGNNPFDFTIFDRHQLRKSENDIWILIGWRLRAVKKQEVYRNNAFAVCIKVQFIQPYVLLADFFSLRFWPIFTMLIKLQVKLSKRYIGLSLTERSQNSRKLLKYLRD